MFPKHTTKTGPELEVGDVVWAHGARLRLTAPAIDAARAKELAESHRALMLHHARTDQDRARVEAEFQRSITLRSFYVELVGNLWPETPHLIPKHWLPGYVVQGNHLATWPVEVPEPLPVAA